MFFFCLFVFTPRSMIFSLISKFAQRTQKYARLICFGFFFPLKISLKDIDVYAWTFHWIFCRFSKSVVKLKKKKKKKSNFHNDRKISQPIKIKRFIVILVLCIKKITSKLECSEKDFSRHFFFFSLPKLWFCNFYSKKLRRTRKSLSSSNEQIKEFNDFQFKYFPLKSEKKISFLFSIHL